MRGTIASLARALVALAVVALALAGSASAITLPAGFQATKLASGLSGTVSVAWAPDGRMFVASAAGGGTFYIYNPGATTPSATRAVGGNIYGIATDSSFASNHFLYFAKSFGGNTSLRVTRVAVNNDNTLANATSPETVLMGKTSTQPCPAPSNTNDCIPAFSPHDVNAVLSDPSDGTLWVAMGDLHALGSPDTVQTYNEQSYAGKILHVDRNGNGLPGHPFCPSDTNLTHVCTKVWATGFKNPYRFTLGPDGLPLVGDVGWRSREEISRVRGGHDYGWPCYEGFIRTPGFVDLAACGPEYAKEGGTSAAVNPLYDYGHTSTSAAIVGGPVYPGGAYPAAYAGTLFFGDYVNGWIKLARFGTGGSIQSVSDFATGAGAITDLQRAPDGNLVVVTLPGAVTEIRYVGAGNRAPVAHASADPTAGPAPLTVDFTGDGSSDPDGDALTYDWDFGDGSAHSTAANPSHTYAASASPRSATLTVKDTHGATDSATLSVSPGNRPPVVAVDAPLTYRDRTTFTVSGSATDPEDGALPVAALQWNTKLVHVAHTHDPESPAGVDHVDITTRIDHDADSHYEASLTATDSSGASTTKTVRIDPETRRLTLASSPAGAPVSYAGPPPPKRAGPPPGPPGLPPAAPPAGAPVPSAAPTPGPPSAQQPALGFTPPIPAAPSSTSGGHNSFFDGWSEGGAREHQLVVPA